MLQIRWTKDEAAKNIPLENRDSWNFFQLLMDVCLVSSLTDQSYDDSDYSEYHCDSYELAELCYSVSCIVRYCDVGIDSGATSGSTSEYESNGWYDEYQYDDDE